MKLLTYFVKLILLGVTFPGISVEGAVSNCTQCFLNASSKETSRPKWEIIACTFGHNIGKPCPSSGGYSCFIRMVRDEENISITLTRGCEVAANLPSDLCTEDVDQDSCKCDVDNCNNKSFAKYFGYETATENNITDTETFISGNPLALPIATLISILVAMLFVCQ